MGRRVPLPSADRTVATGPLTSLELAGVIFGTIVAAEVALESRLLPRLKAIGGLLRRPFAVLSSPRISDHWKERAAVGYSLRILAASSAALASLAATSAPLATVAWLAAGSLDRAPGMIVSPIFLAASVSTGAVWSVLRLPP
jgi:hypothetical protein